jgi:hypothetical protein
MNFDVDDYLKRLTAVYSFSLLELDNIHSAAIFLKTCVKEGMTLFEIANLVTRDRPDKFSQFETICKEAAWEEQYRTELNVDETKNLFKKSHEYKLAIISNQIGKIGRKKSIQLD